MQLNAKVDNNFSWFDDIMKKILTKHQKGCQKVKIK